MSDGPEGATDEPLSFDRSPVREWPNWRTIVASPVLYAMIVPLVMLDLCAELYHRTVFPLLGLAIVPRRAYIRFDRHHLPYLSPIRLVACAYCGYANGLLQYAARLAGDTEAYFCPIKHRPEAGYREAPHHKDFAEYGDATGFRRRWKSRGPS